MSTKTNDFLREFNRLEKELNDLYHDVALKMGISDSAFSIFYILYTLGDGCLEKDGYIYLKQGRGRDKHIFLTESGRQFTEKHIIPVVQKENAAFTSLRLEEQKELLRLSKIYIENLKTKLREI